MQIPAISIDATLLWVFAAGFLAGALIALGIAWWRQRRFARLLAEREVQIRNQEAVERERSIALARAEVTLAETVHRISNESFSRHSEDFLRLARENFGRHQEHAEAELAERQKAVETLVAPIREALTRTEKQIGELERTRVAAFATIEEQLKATAMAQAQLQQETRNLVTALRRPEVRGQWGEITLRRIAELAGMVEHCDFVEQAHVSTDDGALRPDMIVRLPGRGELVVDVKTPLDAYLAAVEAPDDESRRDALRRHSRNVAERVRELAAKAYWQQFTDSPEFVILFVPGDQFLAAALDENPNLVEDALRQKVVLATPGSLVALLKAIAYGWRQLSLNENAETIRALAQDLHDRLGTFTAHMAKLGRQLDGSVGAFNSAVGSLERKVLPGARKIAELGIQARKSLDDPGTLETRPRGVTGHEQDPPSGG